VRAKILTLQDPILIAAKTPKNALTIGITLVDGIINACHVAINAVITTHALEAVVVEAVDPQVITPFNQAGVAGHFLINLISILMLIQLTVLSTI